MWPWGHLALGYLCYAGYRGVVDRRPPADWPVVAMAIGTQFPDLVDKPLAYWFGLLPEGRTLTHSFVVLVPVVIALLIVARRRGHAEVAVAFTIGWASHLVGDALVPLLEGAYAEVTFLVWPLLPAPDYEAASFLIHGERLVAELSTLRLEVLLAPARNPFVLELWIGAAVVVMWVYHGTPPLGPLRRWLAQQ